ncbi:unnamed protein product, partial [marine sediment metagenome]
MNISKKIVLEKPLIHTTFTRLVPDTVLSDKVDIVNIQTDYFIERGIKKIQARRIAEWMLHNTERLA